MKPLVSILIPAYNVENYIGYTLQSAIAQTWPHKEIIVVDDGSTDRTMQTARQFASDAVKIVSVKNQGAAAARNTGFELSRGDYIQWLDADDLLVPDKIERQLAALHEGDDNRLLLSGPWGYFYFRPQNAKFVPNSLWNDLSPVEWLLRKMKENLHMQTATWLTSRELVQAAGPWDTRLYSDDDGEFFCRVLLASIGTRFVPEAKVYYRSSPSNRLSFIGTSEIKRDALLISMRLHIEYLLSLEDSDRVRDACLTYMQNWFEFFYPERPDLVAEIGALAARFNGQLKVPHLRWKYAWMEPLLGRNAAKWAQRVLPEKKGSIARFWDQLMFKLETRGTGR